MTERRSVHFANSAVTLEYAGERAASIVDFLFHTIPAHGPAQPHITYRLWQQAADLMLFRDDTLLYQGPSPAECADVLMGDSTHALADRSHGGVLFHAAGVVWQGGGLLLPGKIGAGKTTLAAWLATRGFDFLSDELIFVPTGSTALQALTRPLNVKSPARSVLRPYFDFAHHAAQLLSTPRGDLIPHTLLRSGNHLDSVPLSRIILPRYVPQAPFELRPLSKAQAVFALLECLVNARNLPNHGIPQVSQLVQAAPAYRMTYSDFESLIGKLEGVL